MLLESAVGDVISTTTGGKNCLALACETDHPHAVRSGDVTPKYSLEKSPHPEAPRMCMLVFTKRNIFHW